MADVSSYAILLNSFVKFRCLCVLHFNCYGCSFFVLSPALSLVIPRSRSKLNSLSVTINDSSCIFVAWACTFPKDWQGAWYQNVFGELTISETEISRKGVCTANVGNKYVVYSRYSSTSCDFC